jgi:NAD(P)-dependent dehydrogenase (short-subunit alcohol dehydrogenase family)
MSNLKSKIAVVTGASRGAGRGIALVLGEAGATVYVTGRSVRGGATTENLPGTIDETVEAVTARGGVGIAVRCDHTEDTEVEALFERVKQEQGRLDILVNNAWSGYEGFYESWRKTGPYFWQQPYADRWNKMFTAGLRAHFVASCLAAPLMLPQRSGLIVSTIAWDHDKYIGNFYDVAKHAIARMIFGMAIELRKHNIAAVALAPGYMRTERVLAAYAAQPGAVLDYNITESPEYVGRAVVALASDPNVMEKSGRAFRVGELAQEYSFTDVDGRQVPPWTVPDDIMAVLEAMMDRDSQSDETVD